MALMRVKDKDGNIKPILAIKGETGASAYEVAQADGFEGTTSEWLKSLTGPEGDSAYEVAQAAGFEGTREEWLDSLIGPKGDKGDSPVRGVDYWTDTDKEEIKSYVNTATLEGEW